MAWIRFQIAALTQTQLDESLTTLKYFCVNHREFYHILNMLRIKELTSILSNMNNFHSLEVVDRVSETQLQVGENSN